MKELLLSINEISLVPNLPVNLPGSNTLITGDANLGFFGEVSRASFITYEALADLVDIDTGENPNNTSGWLKVAYKGNILYIAKKAARVGVSWEALYGWGIVTKEQNHLVTILGKVYRVRLINGCNVNPYPNNDISVDGLPYGKGTEWNKLMYGLMAGVAASNLEGPALAHFSTADLGLTSSRAGGENTIIQEVTAEGYQITRGDGNNDITGIYPLSPIITDSSDLGWRPVIEYVSG